MFYYDLSFLLASSLVPFSLKILFIYFTPFIAPKKKNSTLENRLFFHDLINQTHSILLYLQHKHDKRSSIEGYEIDELSKEVNLIQKLIHSHFKIEHRNLDASSSGWVGFNFIKPKIERELSIFLIDKGIETNIFYTGFIGPNNKVSDPDKALVKEELFFRIFTNLIKNISEHTPRCVDIYINYGIEGIDFVTKNDAFRLHKDMDNLSGTLHSMICDSRESDQLLHGLGLESVERLANQNGGSFEFSFEDQYWINRVYLPSPSVFERITKDKLLKVA